MTAKTHIFVATIECPEGRFPSVGRLHPPAIRLERALRDLFGLDPVGLPDRRPWLDHGRWDLRHPLANEPKPQGDQEPYCFLPAEGESLHQIAVGPVHAGIIEPGHFRFTANGETVVRLEERLGYTHKGIESLMTRRIRRAGRAPRCRGHPATARSPMALPSPALSKRRSKSKFRRAPFGCAL